MAPPPTPPNDLTPAAARERALALLRRHGWNATSFQILEPGFSYWFDGDDTCVAYIDTGRAWVAAGAPVAPIERMRDVALGFAAAAAACRRRACFFGAEDRFVDAAQPFAAMRIGEQPVWDPTEWDEILGRTRSLREQIRRARAKAVTVRAFDPLLLAEPDGKPRGEVERLVARWEATRPMPPMGFLVQLHLHSQPEERRCFAATDRAGGLIGFLCMVPVFARRGWFIEDLIRSSEAPNGTAELLIDAAMRAAAAEESRYLTLGLAPLAGPVALWLRVARRTGVALYDFRGLHTFKAKLRPRHWSPIFLCHPQGQSGLAAVYDALAAFARGGLLRFGLETLLRRPAVLIHAMALLLIPWTILMASVPSARWFPSPAVKWGWVAFDAALVPALASLARRWRRGLDTLLATLVTADAVATLVQAVAWNLRREPPGPFTTVVVVISVLAPSLAATLLWLGRRSERQIDRA